MGLVAAVLLCKDEVDIIEPVLRHMATQVDFLIVADNNSTDGTKDLLFDLSRELTITVLDDPEVGHYQSRKVTNLAKVARNQGAEWIVPFDSDEIWYSPFGTIKDILSGIASQWLIVSADMYDHVTSSEDDLSEMDLVRRIGWRRIEKGLLPKVACRWREDLIIGEGNHSATYSGGATSQNGLLVIRHFPYRSPEQFARKARNGLAAYEATDLPESVGAHWRGYGSILRSHGEEFLINEVYKKHFHLENPSSLDGVIYDPAPDSAFIHKINSD